MEEKTNGATRASDVCSLGLDLIRTGGPDAVQAALAALPHGGAGAVVVANALTPCDMAVVALGCMQAPGWLDASRRLRSLTSRPSLGAAGGAGGCTRARTPLPVGGRPRRRPRRHPSPTAAHCGRAAEGGRAGGRRRGGRRGGGSGCGGGGGGPGCGWVVRWQVDRPARGSARAVPALCDGGAAGGAAGRGRRAVGGGGGARAWCGGGGAAGGQVCSNVYRGREGGESSTDVAFLPGRR